MFISDISQKKNRKTTNEKVNVKGRIGRISIGMQQASFSNAKQLEFVDIIESMIDMPEHSNTEVIEMVRLMQNELDRVKNSKYK